MRFGVVHRFMTNALAALGVLALVSSGQFSRLVSAIVVIGLILALLVRESWQRHPAFKHADTVSLLGVIALQITRFLLGVSLLELVIEFAAALQLIRLATRRGAVHDQQVIILALLHLIAGTVLGGGLAYGFCFAGVLIVTPGALVLSHLRREVEGNYRQGARDRTGLPVDVPRILRSRRVVGRSFILVTCFLAVPIFLFTGALFLTFPRVGLSILMLNRHPGERMIGFSDRVELGQVGELRSNPTVALRVEMDVPDPPPERVTLYLRGSALDEYDGRSWSKTSIQPRPAETFSDVILVEPPRLPPATAQTMRIDLEAWDPPVVFIPPGAQGLKVRGTDSLLPSQRPQIFRGAEGELRHGGGDRGIEYDVLVAKNHVPSFELLADADRGRYLKLPDITERTRELAIEWTANETTSLGRARAIEKRLRSDYQYSLNSPSGGSKDPLDHFLFESRRGHCEFFSTAMAIMLRVVDTPTRNVTGFGGGSYNRFGKFYMVRQADAHSWVEVYIDGHGWMTFDPTPPSGTIPVAATGPFSVLRDFLDATSQRWDRHVVGYNLEQQYGLFRSVSTNGSIGSLTPSRNTVFAVGGTMIAVAAVGYWVVRRRKKVAASAEQGMRTPSEAAAAELYELLEQAMGVHGIHRAPGTPPLRHAQNLERVAHPFADDILTLTRIYLDVRFGKRDLSEKEARELRGQIRALKSRELAT